MSAKTGPVRRVARSYGQSSAGLAATAPPGEGEGSEKGDAARRAILEATAACFAEFGWSGTNMSSIARRSGMTRGRIQYYFPTLDDLLRAAIDYLLVEWRKRYFSLITEAAGPAARFDAGLVVLWELMRDPLHVAKQELEATARTNPELRALLEQSAIEDDEASIAGVKEVYPELAKHGEAAVRRARDFTVVFMEGLASFRFSSDAEARRRELLEMLNQVLSGYWTALGSGPRVSPAAPPEATANAVAPGLDAEKRDRALSLLREAAALLSPE